MNKALWELVKYGERGYRLPTEDQTRRSGADYDLPRLLLRQHRSRAARGSSGMAEE